jgi:lysozyme
MDIQRLVTQLTTDEDKRHKPYRDTVGKLTIGVGRNLDDRGLSDDEIAYLLANDIKIVEKELDREIPWWRGLNDARQNVLANMAFNMGVPSLLAFKNTLLSMRNGSYNQAADGMMSSKWATQVGDRAKRLARQMQTGVF